VRAWHTWVGLICVALALTSCASWQARYLKEGVNQATMDEVEKHLGRSHSTWGLRTGETLWTYQSGMPSGTDTAGVTIVGPGWVIGRRSDCTEYVLLFDQQKILRAWMRQPCKLARPVSRVPTDQQTSARPPHRPRPVLTGESYFPACWDSHSRELRPELFSKPVHSVILSRETSRNLGLETIRRAHGDIP
jgi:hypothetical protein